MKTKVGLVKGDDRFANVYQALVNAGEELTRKIRGKVVVKVNTVMEDEPLANTHPEALRALLEFLRPLNLDRVIVGEASCAGLDLFRRCGYLDVVARYGAEALDFNTTGFDELTLLSIEQAPLPATITRIHRDFDCLISLSVPKAHSDAVVTLSGKNMMGFLEGGKQWKIHGVEKFSEHLPAMAKVIHRNLRTLLATVRPDVAVLDGFHSFEAGPVPQCGRGTLVHPKLAMAGSDFVAVDTVAATVLGFDPQDVGYLVYSARDGYGTMDLARIEVVGTPIAEARFPLKPAPTIDIILGWKEPAVA
jgi:uncharacterized protein (DUF362 family)